MSREECQTVSDNKEPYGPFYYTYSLILKHNSIQSTKHFYCHKRFDNGS